MPNPEVWVRPHLHLQDVLSVLFSVFREGGKQRGDSYLPRNLMNAVPKGCTKSGQTMAQRKKAASQMETRQILEAADTDLHFILLLNLCDLWVGCINTVGLQYQ